MIVKKVSEDLTTPQARQNWLEYWRHFSEQSSEFCAEINCLNHYAEGVLVTRSEANASDNVFVIPLCRCHSDNLQGSLEVGDQTEVIPCHYTL
jgi:hypothetical protein